MSEHWRACEVAGRLLASRGQMVVHNLLGWSQEKIDACAVRPPMATPRALDEGVAIFVRSTAQRAADATGLWPEVIVAEAERRGYRHYTTIPISSECWSGDDNARMRKAYKNCDMEQLAHELGRSRKALKEQARRLGLAYDPLRHPSRDRPYRTPEGMEAIIKRLQEATMAAVAAEYGVTRGTIAGVVRDWRKLQAQSAATTLFEQREER